MTTATLDVITKTYYMECAAQLARDRFRYIPMMPPASTATPCDYCGTLFTLDKSCGCGANRCARVSRPSIIAEGQRHP